MQNTLRNISAKWLGFLILIILFAFLNYNSGTLLFKDNREESSKLNFQEVKNEFPMMTDYRESVSPGELSAVMGRDGELIAHFLVSADNRWNYSGYTGSVPLMVKFDIEKRITGIVLLENRETRRFLLKLYNLAFLESWNGMTLAEAADSSVDTVTGVTLTSKTVIANFSEFLEENQGHSPMGKTDYRKLLILPAEILLLVFALLSFFRRDMKRYRIPLLILNIMIFGFIAGDFISLAMIRGFLTGSVPFYANPVLWILLVLSIVIPLVTNKGFYCTHVCPFGAAQELAGKLTARKHSLPGKLLEFSKILRPLLFGLLVLIIILDYKVDLSLVEPFAAFLYSVAAPVTIILAAGSLVLSLFFSKPWCRWFCPTGQLLEYFRSDS